MGRIALSEVLQIAVVQVPLLNAAFDFTPPSIDRWALCTGLASVVLWSGETKKLIETLLRGLRDTQPSR